MRVDRSHCALKPSRLGTQEICSCVPSKLIEILQLQSSSNNKPSWKGTGRSGAGHDDDDDHDDIFGPLLLTEDHVCTVSYLLRP